MGLPIALAIFGCVVFFAFWVLTYLGLKKARNLTDRYYQVDNVEYGNSIKVKFDVSPKCKEVVYNDIRFDLKPLSDGRYIISTPDPRVKDVIISKGMVFCDIRNYR